MIANITTDASSGSRYKRSMVGKARYPKPPASPDNAWVRDALEAARMKQIALAQALSERLGDGYTKFTVRDMVNTRRISSTEAMAISEITGHPLPSPVPVGLTPAELADIAYLTETYRLLPEGLRKGFLHDAETARLAAEALAQRKPDWTNPDPEADGSPR